MSTKIDRETLEKFSHQEANSKGGRAPISEQDSRLPPNTNPNDGNRIDDQAARRDANLYRGGQR